MKPLKPFKRGRDPHVRIRETINISGKIKKKQKKSKRKRRNRGEHIFRPELFVILRPYFSPEKQGRNPRALKTQTVGSSITWVHPPVKTEISSLFAWSTESFLTYPSEERFLGSGKQRRSFFFSGTISSALFFFLCFFFTLFTQLLFSSRLLLFLFLHLKLFFFSLYPVIESSSY